MNENETRKKRSTKWGFPYAERMSSKADGYILSQNFDVERLKMLTSSIKEAVKEYESALDPSLTVKEYESAFASSLTTYVDTLKDYQSKMNQACHIYETHTFRKIIESFNIAPSGTYDKYMKQVLPDAVAVKSDWQSVGNDLMAAYFKQLHVIKNKDA
ncbi:MAG: hypothetical protein JMN25_12540 [gamma proteobacterium endosymbiont of Lamellibrachia anaximandri]|nr:hypothetical protein [gamma proteobacterium endosymbiont of Lamellibrachia anaximandri]